MKNCSKCIALKPFSEFYTGMQTNICKECLRKYQQAIGAERRKTALIEGYDALNMQKMRRESAMAEIKAEEANAVILAASGGSPYAHIELMMKATHKYLAL